MVQVWSSYSEYLNFIESQFEKCFASKRYFREHPIKITSRVDDSVVFIGSTTSPLKKYLFGDGIGSHGRFLIQNCIKTYSLQNLMNTNSVVFGSYFKEMGVMSEATIEDVAFDTFDYLINYLGISIGDIRVEISLNDPDLLKAVNNIDKKINVKVAPHDSKRHRHTYGYNSRGLVGRNINILIKRNSIYSYIEVGNVIALEIEGKKIATEMGFSNTVLSMCEFGSTSTIACSRIADVFDIENIGKLKFADAITVVSILLYEDIQNHPKYSRYFKRWFQKYCKVILFWQDKLGIDDFEVLSYMKRFISYEYSANLNWGNSIAKLII